MARPHPRRQVTPAPLMPKPPIPRPIDDGDGFALEIWGERLRRLALGLLAALIACRPYWPAEDASTGSGLVWVFSILLVAGLAILAMIVGGSFRPRWSLVDLTVVTLIIMVGMSAGHAADRRAAIIMAWEWGGLGIAYLLARQLPRTKGESQALFGVIAASAVAVAAYGLFQIQVELAEIRKVYQANPASALARIGISGDVASRAAFESRLLNSKEPWATFALTNSLAGFLVGPLVLGLAIAIERLRKAEPLSTKIQALMLAAIPGAVLAACILATKSRSAYLGLAAGLALVVFRTWAKLPGKMLGGLIVAGVIGIGSLVGIARGPGNGASRDDVVQLTWIENRTHPQVPTSPPAWHASGSSRRGVWAGCRTTWRP